MHLPLLSRPPPSLNRMPPLVDTQAAIANAMISGSDAELPDSLFRGRGGIRRFNIHIRHFQASLTSTLIQKYPATEWLVGRDLLALVALEYVRTGAPTTPCIAEYGGDFPEFLARSERTGHWPWIESFARLDWLLGKASIAIDEPPLRWSEITASGPEALLDTRVTLQPGMAFLRAAHAVDDIILSYLTGKEPQNGPVAVSETCIEIHGSRGAFSLSRISPSQFEFRHALYSGVQIGEAASMAMEVDSTFDAGQALRDLTDAGHIAARELVS